MIVFLKNAFINMSLHLYGQNLVNIFEVIGTSVFTFIILGLFSFIYCTYANLVNVIALVDVINELHKSGSFWAVWNGIKKVLLYAISFRYFTKNNYRPFVIYVV